MVTYTTNRLYDGLLTTYNNGYVVKWCRETKDLTLTKNDEFLESKDLTGIRFLEKDYFYLIEAVKKMIDDGELN